MNRSFYMSLVILSVAFLLQLMLVGCGDDGDTTVDPQICDPACETGLVCMTGSCLCEVENCCVSVEDCDAGEVCDPDTHLCKMTLPPDGDSDGDFDSDDELDDVDTIDIDGDVENTDNDSIECADGECDIVDGDTENDTTPAKSCVYGLDKLTQVDKLPYYEQATVTKQFSSRDPKEENDDTITQYIALENSENIIMHSKTPGCIYRIWFGCPGTGAGCLVEGHRIRFYFNGETTPSINMPASEFFAGTTAPFLSPLVGKLSESYYSNLPICYSSEIKVSISGATQGYNITYQDHPDCGEIEDFSNEMDVSGLIDFFDNHLGEDPKPDVGNLPRTFTPDIEAGESKTVFEDFITAGNAGKAINAIYLDLTPVDDDILNNTWIEIYWDGKDDTVTPDVNAPLGMFFGSGFGEVEFQSLMMGMTTNGKYYSFWPMPYWKQAVIKINNKSTTNIQKLDIEIIHGENNYPQNESAHFKAQYNESIPTAIDSDYKALEDFGTGKIVGITMAMDSLMSYPVPKAYLEGDERIFIDGMNFPTVRGTGTDNFFNGNELWRTAAYETPLFSLWKTSNYRYSARKLMLGDSIPFSRSVSFGFEHGGENDINGNYRSVVYYYMSCLEGMALSDQVCMGVYDSSNPCSEGNHEFNIQLTADANQHRDIPGSYEGEDHEDITYDTCNGILSLSSNKGYMVMKVNIRPDNQGVRLIRKLTHTLKNGSTYVNNQEAKVFVGDAESGNANLVEVGSWYTPGYNIHKNWQDSIFDIPEEFVKGKSKIKLLFEHAGGSEWNICDLKVYSIIPQDSQSEGPGQVDSIDYEVLNLRPCLSWSPPSDGVPPQYYHIYRHTDLAFDCDEEFYIETVTENEFCEPESLEAQTHYYYRIKAEDCTATKGVCSDKFDVYSGLEPFCMQAETTYDGALSTPTYANSPDAYQIRTGTQYAGNQMIHFMSEAVNQRLVLKYDIQYSAEYQIDVTFLKGPDMGIIKLLVGSVVQGTYDLYSATEELVTVDFGTRSLTAGTKSFVFKVDETSPNPASSGHHMGIDEVCLGGLDLPDGDVDTEE